MRIVLLTFISLLIAQNLKASNELITSFFKAHDELSSLLINSSNKSLQSIGEKLGENILDVRVILPSDFNSDSHRNSAFYSNSKVFLSSALSELPEEDLMPLFIHEILSSNNIGDADYKLSQMLYWHSKNMKYSSEDKYLSKMIEERIEFSRVYSNEPVLNRSLSTSNGGSIVGGGGEYIESIIYSKFLQRAMERRLGILGDQYVYSNPGTIASLVNKILSMITFQKRSCIKEDVVVYINKYNVFELPKTLIIYSQEESAELILGMIDSIDQSELNGGKVNFKSQFPRSKVFSKYSDFVQHLKMSDCSL